MRQIGSHRLWYYNKINSKAVVVCSSSNCYYNFVRGGRLIGDYCRILFYFLCSSSLTTSNYSNNRSLVYASFVSQQPLPFIGKRNSRFLHLQAMSQHEVDNTSSSLCYFHTSLQEYIIQRKEQPTTHIVMGNEACDADSIVSSICYGYIHDCFIQQQNTVAAVADIMSESKAVSVSTITPIISMSQKDIITQRPETIVLFQLAGITKEVIWNHLWFTNQYTNYINQLSHDTSSVPTAVCHINVTLVDHNRFCPPSYKKDAAARTNIQYTVTGIFDHHVDEQQHFESTTVDNNSSSSSNSSGHQESPQQIDQPFRNIAYDKETNVALVASTCTLMVELIQQLSDSTKAIDDSSQKYIPASLSILLLGVILLDSVNMGETAGKGTIRDANAIQYLLHHTHWDTLDIETKKQLLLHNDNCGSQQTDVIEFVPDTTQLFQLLQNAKFSLEFWNSLSIIDALQLDYKQFQYNTNVKGNDINVKDSQVFGMSTILMSMKNFMEKEDYDVMMYHIYQFMISKSIALLGIMFASSSNSGTDENSNSLVRELVLIGIKNNSTTLTASIHDVVNELSDYLLHVDCSLELEDVTTSTVSNDNNKNESDILNVRFFQQNNAVASRKQVAPILLHYLSTSGSNDARIV